MAAAGIENKSALIKTLHLLTGLCGKMINFSDIASEVSVQMTTVQSWTLILEQNGLLKTVSPYFSNLNKRLIKTPKLYFEDTGLAVRLQGCSEYEPLFLSPYFGHLIENLAYSEISKFFSNNLLEPKIFFVRNKEKVEIDFLLELPNKKFIAIEVKTNPQDFSKAQLKLLESLDLNIVGHWVVSLNSSAHFGDRKVILIEELYSELETLFKLKVLQLPISVINFVSFNSLIFSLINNKKYWSFVNSARISESVDICLTFTLL